MTNIHDIARLSGYSVSTVSRVLNHQNYVSAKTRGDIEAVINKLDYVPNAVARNNPDRPHRPLAGLERKFSG